MSSHKHNIELQGAKPRDHAHPRHSIWRHPHRDWRAWLAVGLMLAMILVYVFSDDLAFSPWHRTRQPTPAISAP
jgi:hypothetical protein